MDLKWLTKSRNLGGSAITHSIAYAAILVFVLSIFLHSQGVDVLASLKENFFSYSDAPPAEEVILKPKRKEKPKTEQEAVSQPEVLIKDDNNSTDNEPGIETTPSVALYPLNFSQYQKYHTDGLQASELITSLLMINLSRSKQFELLDRSEITTLFAEKSLLLVSGDENSNNQTEFAKIPVSDFTLVGNLFASKKKKLYNLKLVRNNTGEIIGAARFYYSSDNINDVIIKSSSFVNELFLKLKSETALDRSYKNKVAFGHFIDISNTDSQINQSRNITERLIEKYTKRDDYQVLLRTQVFPLVLESYLRTFQYADGYNEATRKNSDYFIHGKYRIDRTNKETPLFVYLYIDMIKNDRKLVALQARNWGDVYKLINKEIKSYLPAPRLKVSDKNIKESDSLFREAISQRGLYFKKQVLSGAHPPNRGAIDGFSSKSKPKKLESARKLVEQSLELNPHNYYAKLAMARMLESEGKQQDSLDILQEVLKAGGSPASIAYSILQVGNKKSMYDIKKSAFEDIVGPEKLDYVFSQLIKEKYLRDIGIRVDLNEEQDLNRLINAPYSLKLTGINDVTTAHIFERLRSYVYSPGAQIQFIEPKSFRMNDVFNKKNWFQMVKLSKRDTESVINHDIAASVSKMFLVKESGLPYLAFYSSADQESEIRRRYNLEVAIDGFAASAYLDAAYYESLVFLAHSFCQKVINRCSSGDMVNAWVVERTKAENLHGRGGTYFNVTEELEKKDQYIFVAAKAIGQVEQANLTEMFLNFLRSEGYSAKKSNNRLDNLTAKADKSIPKNNEGSVFYAYRETIEAHCMHLSKKSSSLRRARDYIGPVQKLARMAVNNEKAAAYRKALLTDLRRDYPGVYPYLIINNSIDEPFVRNEQDLVIKEVTSGEIVPIKISDFMKIVLKVFEKRVALSEIEVARQYIQYFINYYGVNQKNAIDFSFLYYQVGDFSKSEKLINDFGKRSFNISDFTVDAVNGDYFTSGLNAKGQLKFLKKNDENFYIVYSASSVRYGLGEKSIKWRLYYKDSYNGFKSYSGNNNKNRELFAFGNGGKLAGKMKWTSPLHAKAIKPVMAYREDVPETFSLDKVIEVPAAQNGKNNDQQLAFEKMFLDKHYLDVKHSLAIKGHMYEDTIGPVQDAYFSSSNFSGRSVSAIKEELFQKGYLTVSGEPIFDSKYSLKERISTDFASFTSTERFYLVEALSRAKKVKNSGVAKIYGYESDTVTPMATLVPDDPIEERLFGAKVAVYNNRALVCDAKDGLYSFLKVNADWAQQSRKDVRCKSLAMNGKWAAVGSWEKVYVYQVNNGEWEEAQVLKPDKYLQNKDKRHNYDYFGEALAVSNDTIIVGSPYGGLKNTGEVYVYTFLQDEWEQTDKLIVPQGGSAHGK